MNTNYFPFIEISSDFFHHFYSYPLTDLYIYDLHSSIYYFGASQVALIVKNPPTNAGDIGDMGLIPGSGRYPGEQHGNPLQYSCLEHHMDGGAWWVTVHGTAESRHDGSY